MKLWPLIFMLLSTLAHAGPFTGRWQGSGHISRDDGVQFECNRVDLAIFHDNESLNITFVEYDCGEIQIDYYDWYFQIRKGRLYFQDQLVGSVDNLNVEIRYQRNLLEFYMHLRLNPDGSLSVLDKTLYTFRPTHRYALRAQIPRH